MHRLRTVPGGWNPGEAGVIAIELTPGAIVVLSATDTDLQSLARAYRRLREGPAGAAVTWPTLRLTNLLALKQELTIDTYLEDVVAQSRLVVARLLGGVAYFPYLVPELEALSAAHGFPLVFLPGYNEPDPECLERSRGVAPEDYQKLWQLLASGGPTNAAGFLSLLLRRFFALPLADAAGEGQPDLLLYHPPGQEHAQPAPGQPIAGIIGYRAHLLAENQAPFDALWAALEAAGFFPRCVLAHTLRDRASVRGVIDLLTPDGASPPACLINTTSFATKAVQDARGQTPFAALDVPVLQAILASTTHAAWHAGDFGLPPTDLAISVALPEVDGRIITRAVSFKSPFQRDAATEADLSHYEPHPPGIRFVAHLARHYVRLRALPPAAKRVALILPNYPNKDARLANGVGLDTPASVVAILQALRQAGYTVGPQLPASAAELLDRLVSHVTNDTAALGPKKAEVILDDAVFQAWCAGLAPALRARVSARWGDRERDPFFHAGHWQLPGTLLGNLWVTLQPARGYHLDPAAAYHCPDLPPPWGYLAFHCYLAKVFAAHAVVHVGKHGNLEWLPGKSLALDPESCFPAALMPPVPHFYPFIVNDPGEGTQAKRRTHAVILDHLIPPMTRAETYGPLIALEQRIDEYDEACALDPPRALHLREEITRLLDETHLRVDLGLGDGALDTVLTQLDGYLCEIKEAQIRDGLHILGQAPAGRLLLDTLVALHRLPVGELPGMTQALARDQGLAFDPLATDYATPLRDLGLHVPGARSVGDLVTALEDEAREALGQWLEARTELTDKPALTKVFAHIAAQTLPHLQGTRAEIDNLLRGLAGRFIDAGPSGAPTRGRLDVLPTGRNFYAVDLRAIPTPAAWELGRRSAARLVQRYVQDHGEYPRTLALSVWGTSTMRTGGDDVAQALALLGVRPVWRGVSSRVADFEVLSLAELGRPRVDVTLRISGFFRDAFPEAIALVQAAVRKVAEEDEPAEDNPLRQSVRDEATRWQREGFSAQEAGERALYRVFGSKPGSYGAGLQELINNRNWSTREDLAAAYLHWGCHAYTGRARSAMVPEVFRHRLAQTQVILQNQDNREHDILDSDDYYQFHGGMANAAETLAGEAKTVYFGDHSRPENPRIKTLKAEILKVYRSRVINPKWMRGMRRHGYKGAFEMAATVDYLFAYDATARVVEDFVYEGVAQAYLQEDENRAFLRAANPWALRDIAERLYEAAQRGLWQAPPADLLAAIQAILLEGEGEAEERLSPPA